MAQEDGGAAFPVLEKFQTYDDDKGCYRDTYQPFGGMSLRDYFAAKALAGICGDGIPGSHHVPANTAHDAYAYADAMLAERVK